MKKRRACALPVLVAFAVSAGAASFDPVSGTGEITPADLRLPFGWTDPQFQERAPAVSFSFMVSGRYTAVCVSGTPQGGVAEERNSQAYRWVVPVNSMLRYEAKETSRIVGFQLLGFAPTPGTTAPLPQVGEPCVGMSGAVGAWSVVTPDIQTRALSASYAGVDVQLPF